MIFRVLLSCGTPTVPTEAPAERAAEAPTEAPAERAAEAPPSAAIVIETPAPGTPVTPGPLLVKGQSRVFEGRFTVKLLAGDELLGQKAVLTSSEGGTWRVEFDVPVGNSGGAWKIQAYSQSAKDGSIANLVEVPLEGP